MCVFRMFFSLTIQKLSGELFRVILMPRKSKKAITGRTQKAIYNKLNLRSHRIDLREKVTPGGEINNDGNYGNTDKSRKRNASSKKAGNISTKKRVMSISV